MRRKCLFFLLCILTTAVAFAGKESLYVLYEGFENGMPATWTQESISGQVLWTVEQSGESKYPEQAFKGNGLVALRNTTGQTQNFKTMLVTPVMDLAEVFQPILIFSRAQMQYAGDVDAFRVYYRTAADVRWVEIANYTSKTKGWQTDTIYLTAPSKTYQLAFEGVDNMGRGVALDEVIVRPMPTCNDPSNISADGLTVNSALLRWTGSLDTDSFNVVLATSQQTNMDNLTDVVKNEFVSDFKWEANGLERNTKYYLYVQAYCGNSESEWAAYTFTTKNLVDLPYEETFDMEYAQASIAPVPYWTHGTSLYDDNGDMLLMPYINQNVPNNKRNEYSYNKSTALVFNGAKTSSPSSEVFLPAGHYAYAATPEINTTSVSKLQATFWGICYDYVCDAFMASLIVGVMDDPADFSTFVAVDTVRVKEYRTHQRFTVNFDSYKGQGKYIAFASNFNEKPNVFYMDDLTIEEIGVKEVTDLVVTNCLGARFDVNANLNGKQQVKLLVPRDTIDAQNEGAIFYDPTVLPESAIYCDKVLSASELPYTVQLPEGGKIVQVYMRAVSGTEVSKFTTPKKVLVPQKFTEKVYVDFETAAGADVWTPNNLTYFCTLSSTYPFPYSIVSTPTKFINGYHKYPYVYITTSTTEKPGNNGSKGRVLLAKELLNSVTGECGRDQEIGDYIALPEVDDLKSVYLSFYMKYYSTKGNSNLAVGVMTDPFDPTTFDTLAIFANNEDEWKPVVITFDKYTGKGKFPALMAIDAPGASGAYFSAQVVDDIVLDIKPDCMEPTNIQAEVLSDSEIKVTWEGHGMAEWAVNLYVDAAGTKKVDSAIVNVPTHTFKNLKPHTYYYYGVSTKCGATLTEAFLERATTWCPDVEKLPFIEDFEGWDGNSVSMVVEPLCWVMPKYGTEGVGYFPYTDVSGSRAYRGKGAWVSYFTGSAQPTQDLYTALPLMNEEIQKLQIKFYARPAGIAYVGDYLYVGLMTDPNDLATFDTVAAVEMLSDKYTDYIVPFYDYQGEGKYIALMVPQVNYKRGIHVDDIMVDYLSDCEKIQNVTARNTTPTGADIYWKKTLSTKWEVVLTTDTLTLGSSVEVDGTKVLSLKPTTTMPFTVDNCPQPNKNYYVYVRAVCDETNKGEWSNAISFETTCYPTQAGELGVVGFAHADDLACWMVGMRQGGTANNMPKVNNEFLTISNTASTDGAYAIMPMLEIDSISRLQVEFEAHGGTSATELRELTVGVITNPSDLSTFVKMVTIKMPVVASNSSKGQHYTVRFNDYQGDYNGQYGKHIMFLSENGGKANKLYLDNVRVDTVGSCIEPLQVVTLEANTNDLTIGWETLPSNKYQVQLLTEDQKTIVVDTIVTNATSVKFDGLTMLTSYYVKVRQLCEEDETSIWSSPVLVQTVCPAYYPLPYIQDFEDYSNSTTSIKYQPECWEVLSNQTSTTVNKNTCVYTSAKKDSKMGYIMYAATSGNLYSYVVLPNFEGKISDMMISFDYYNQANVDQQLILGVATDVTSVEAIEASLTVIDTLIMPKATARTWDFYQKGLSDFTGESGNIVLIAKGNHTTYFDNLIVEKAPSCFRPIGLTVGEVTKTTVELSWTPMGKETAWDIECVNLLTNDTAYYTANATTTTINGLQNSTDYQFNVRANCGTGNESEWGTTPVEVTTVYFVELVNAKWNFDNPATYTQSPYGTKNIVKGLTVGNGKSTSIGYTPYLETNSRYPTSKSKTQTINQRFAKSDSVALRIHSNVSSSTFANQAYATLPEINANLDELQVRFYGRGITATGSIVQNVDSFYKRDTEVSELKIGTVEVPGDISTFEPLTEYRFTKVTKLDSIVDGAYWEEVIVPLYGAKGKYITLLADEDTTSRVYVDDIVVEYVTGCPVPNLVSIDVVKHNSVSFSWKSAEKQWEVQIIEQGTTNIVDQAIISQTTWTSNKVQASSNYQFKVRTVCGEGEYSAWRTCDFQTPCTPIAQYEEYVYNFEENLYTAALNGSTELKLPECWLQGKRIEGDQPKPAYTSAIIYNTTNIQYSHNEQGEDNTKNAALRLYNYGGTYSDSYVILPEVSFDVDSMNLRFWARAAIFNAYTHKNLPGEINALNKDYQKDLIIGAIANIYDLSTFVPLDTFTYSAINVTKKDGQSTKDDLTGNKYWEEVIIPLKKYQGKGRIMMLYPNNGKTSYMFIDDLEIVPGDFCVVASNLRATEVTATSATLNWHLSGNDSVLLQVATESTFSKASMLVDTILVNANGKYVLNNLNPSTTYYYQVQHICSSEQSAEFAISNFNTLYAVRFFENFSESRLIPLNWSRAKSVPEEIFTGESKLNYNDDKIEYNWLRTTECAFAPVAMRTYTSNSYTSKENHWLITPVIDMTYTDDKNPLTLSLQLGLSNRDGANIQPNATAAGDKFLVAVSLDGGATWNAENTFWWSDVKEDNPVYAYSDITLEGKTFSVDMSQYVGKQVQLAFISYSDKTNSDNHIYLANVSINGVEITNYASTICQWCDYDDDNFSIDAYELVVGETTSYTTYVQDEKVDKYTTLTLTVDNAAQTSFEATICEGEDYMQNGFDIQNAVASGVYKQKLEGANTCDSVVVLNLTVMPKLYTTVEETICQGNYYEFNGVKYYTSTVKSDTLSSVVTGCDSIVSLYLTVNEILAGEAEDIHLCPADSIELGKFGLITEPGTYVDTLKTALLCDSVATWNVFFHEAADTLIRAAICQGESYSNDVWVGLTQAGVYPSEQKTVWGCDSIVTLDLLVAGADLTITDTIEVEELPYVLNGEELLPVGTEIGIYTKTLNLGCGEATVVIMVGQLTDINNVFTNSLAVAPNLVAVGQETNVYGSFASDAVLEVYHTTGALVYRSASTNVVPGLPTAGVYMVTVKSNNQMYQSMLIVQ